MNNSRIDRKLVASVHIFDLNFLLPIGIFKKPNSYVFWLCECFSFDSKFHHSDTDTYLHFNFCFPFIYLPSSRFIVSKSILKFCGISWLMTFIESAHNIFSRNRTRKKSHPLYRSRITNRNRFLVFHFSSKRLPTDTAFRI